MSGNYQYALLSLPSTCTYATSEVAGYVKERVNDPYNPLRMWYSTATSAQRLILDYGAVMNGGIYVVNYANFLSIQIAGGDSPSDPDHASFNNNSTFALTYDNWVKRYKTSVIKNHASKRYTRITIPNQSTTDGKSGFQASGILCVPGLITLPRSAQEGESYSPYPEHLQSGRFTSQRTPYYMEVINHTIRFPEEELLVWQTFALLNMQTPFLFFFNDDRPEEFYIMRHTERPTFARNYGYREVTLNMREVY